MAADPDPLDHLAAAWIDPDDRAGVVARDPDRPGSKRDVECGRIPNRPLDARRLDDPRSHGVDAPYGSASPERCRCTDPHRPAADAYGGWDFAQPRLCG